MKRIILPIFALLLLSFSTGDTGLTDAERKLAAEEMTRTSALLFETLDGLSEAQLNYKPSLDVWSIAECTEHIAISENMIFGMLQGTLKVAADKSKRSEVKMSDEQILGMMVDRSTKVKTQKPFEPSGKFGNAKETLKAFKSKRKENIHYVNSTEDDLRNHYAELPFGTIDAYQVLLFMSAHTERHVIQIQEVRHDKGFPKSTAQDKARAATANVKEAKN